MIANLVKREKAPSFSTRCKVRSFYSLLSEHYQQYQLSSRYLLPGIDHSKNFEIASNTVEDAEMYWILQSPSFICRHILPLFWRTSKVEDGDLRNESVKLFRHQPNREYMWMAMKRYFVTNHQFDCNILFCNDIDINIIMLYRRYNLFHRRYPQPWSWSIWSLDPISEFPVHQHNKRVVSSSLKVYN
jgi:hypothetical protein